MTAGTLEAATHGPVADAARNQTPFWQAYQVMSSTLMIGTALFTTYFSGVSGIGWRSGFPSMFGVNWTLLGLTWAICGIWLAITASCACGVPGTEARTFSLGLSSGILANSGGRASGAR